MRILVTGYGPFAGVPVNVTETLARRCGHPHAVLEVSYEAVDAFLDALDPNSFDALLALGHDKNASKVKIETLGRNQTGREDNRGFVPGGAIAPESPGDLPATLWRGPLLEESDAWTISDDAGNFLCNYILYRGLQKFPDKRVGFLHMPPETAVPIEKQLEILQEIVSLLQEAPAQKG